MFHLDLKLLRSFAAVASECSVTRAAERLHLTQPTVSGQIKELEQSLGFVLFHRTTRQVTLSEHGERLLPMIQSLLHRAEEVRREAEAMQHDTVTRFRLGAAMYSMDFSDRLELLDAFSVARPDMRWTIDNRLQSDQVRDLLSERLDAALLLGIAAPTPASDFARDAHPGEIVNEVQYPDSLKRVILRRRKIGLLVPEESALASMDVIPRSALEGLRVAMLSNEHGDALINPLASFLLNNGAVPLALAEGNALAIERYALRNGLPAIGIGWFPCLPGAVRRPVEGMDFHLDFSVVLGSAPNKAARRFFDFACQWQIARDALGDAGMSGDRFSVTPVGECRAATLQ
ncbi:LysR family transcriptional regulator [Sphingobium boeckii]|uniref:DNA-binding transcriptional LysR family regulator n=1 Tax=Sphingobium boeckii TaxID=1082345 RepID=A0A7W9AI41_9SPHN|nr:LysR family transcriptional regulator [Sphingobium boeckii]MBB5685901.1 DNA-binding transcriptional LysR family regulator [Sphingobium boeckii]